MKNAYAKYTIQENGCEKERIRDIERERETEGKQSKRRLVDFSFSFFSNILSTLIKRRQKKKSKEKEREKRKVMRMYGFLLKNSR